MIYLWRDKNKLLKIAFSISLLEVYMNNFFGPRDRNELTDNEELAVLEAYQAAEEYLEMGQPIEDEFIFESEE